MKYLCFAVMLLFWPLTLATAQDQKPAFFEALYDVPIMPGLLEVKDQTMVFDKPDGKIAIVSAVSKDLSGAQILAFYEGILPQFGWKKIKQNQYVRGKEGLELTVLGKSSGAGVQFTLSPSP